MWYPGRITCKQFSLNFNFLAQEVSPFLNSDLDVGDFLGQNLQIIKKKVWSSEEWNSDACWHLGERHVKKDSHQYRFPSTSIKEFQDINEENQKKIG